jgi:hypothetical protein
MRRRTGTNGSPGIEGAPSPDGDAVVEPVYRFPRDRPVALLMRSTAVDRGCSIGLVRTFSSRSPTQQRCIETGEA